MTQRSKNFRLHLGGFGPGPEALGWKHRRVERMPLLLAASSSIGRLEPLARDSGSENPHKRDSLTHSDAEGGVVVVSLYNMGWGEGKQSSCTGCDVVSFTMWQLQSKQRSGATGQHDPAI